MSLERLPSERATATAVADEGVLSVAARELRAEPGTLSVVRLAGDASSRAFFRVSYPGGSLVAVRYPEPFDERSSSGERLDRWCAARPADGLETFANDPLCHLELTGLLATAGLPVPSVVAVSGADAIILVEDAGDTMLQQWLTTASPAERERAYGRAVDLIAAFRAATSAAREGCAVSGRLAFDEAKLGWELELFRVSCFDRYLGAPLAPGVERAVRADCAALVAELAARPRALCHRDYHARNLMLRPGEPVPDGLVVIDFQDARMGPLTYDLVSILEDPYVPLDAELRERMVDRFAASLRDEPAWPGPEALREEYDLMTAQRLLKAVGTYTSQAVKGNPLYVPYIAPALTRAAAALDRLERFGALREVLDLRP